MLIRTGVEIDNQVICNNLYRIGNQIFKLLPTREEGKDWVKPLETLIVELSGMNSLFVENQKDLFTLICKLEGMRQDPDIKFSLYRRTIFECCSLVDGLKKTCQ